VTHDPLAPLRQGEERSAWLLLRMEADLRQRIETMRAGLADPSLLRTVEGLARPDGAHRQFAEVTRALEEALRALGALRGHLTHPAEGSPRGIHPDAAGGATLPAGLPETLERFLRDRVRAPGFRFDVHHDEVRGWAVRWEERNPDGGIYASGRLYQRPWEWMTPRPQGS
jgi:hypothetical protein